MAFVWIDLIGPEATAGIPHSKPFSQTYKTKKTEVVKAECDWNMERQRLGCFKSQDMWFKERSVPPFIDNSMMAIFWTNTKHPNDKVPLGEWFDFFGFFCSIPKMDHFPESVLRCMWCPLQATPRRRFSSMAWRRWWRCRVNAGSARRCRARGESYGSGWQKGDD